MNPRPERLGPYQIIRPIAEGGIAEIYLARLQTPKTPNADVLALKVIRERFCRDPELIGTLITESSLAVQLQHPNILQIFDLSEFDGRYLMTMEFIDGRDLSVVMSRLKQRRLQMPFAAAAFIVAEASKGLHYAHRCRDQRGLPLNIVHRDVSPQNLLISFQGAVKVADFGIAKANIQRDETQVGIIKGKFAYMSPEQAWGDTLDARADIYALGVILYELLTGQPLYNSADQFTVIKAVRSGNVASPRQLRPDIPSELDAIVMHALERDRNERFTTAADLVKELRRYLDQIAPGYDASILAAFMRQTFGEDCFEVPRLLQSLNKAAPPPAAAAADDLQNTPIPSASPLMGRADYVPAESSLLFDLRAMQAAAASVAPSRASSAPAKAVSVTRPASGPLGRVLSAGIMNQIISELDDEAPSLFVPSDDDHDDSSTLSYSAEELRRASGDFAALTAAPNFADDDDIPTRAIKRIKLPFLAPATPSNLPLHTIEPSPDDLTELDFKAPAHRPLPAPDEILPLTFPPTPTLPELADKKFTPAAFAATHSLPATAPPPYLTAQPDPTHKLTRLPPRVSSRSAKASPALLWAAVAAVAVIVAALLFLLTR
jgi:tRNA A-37 threonylcarbamoyl transferase component Bud32